MEPSRELDELIAAKVLGVKCLHYPHGQDYPYYIPSGKPWRTHGIDAKPLLRFSTDWSAAALVVAEMRRRGWRFSIEDDDEGDIAVHFWSQIGQSVRDRAGGFGKDAPEAICRAALAAVEGGRLPTVDELAGSDPDFTAPLTTDEYIRDVRGN